jgi:hypothetical protein
LLKGRAALKSPKTNTSSNTIEYMDLSWLCLSRILKIDVYNINVIFGT